MDFYCHNCGFEKAISSKYAGKKVKCPKCSESVQLNAITANEETSSNITVRSGHELESFLQKYQYKISEKKFELVNEKLLKLKTGDGVWIKSGSLICSVGDVSSSHKASDESGLNKILSRLNIKQSPFTRIKDGDYVQVADDNKDIHLINMKKDSIVLLASSVLAFEKSLKWSVEKKQKIGSVVKFSGNGYIAISAASRPVIMDTKLQDQLGVMPNALLGWSSGLSAQMIGEKLHFKGIGQVFLSTDTKKSGKTSSDFYKNSVPVMIFIFAMMVVLLDSPLPESQRSPASFEIKQSQMAIQVLEIKKLESVIEQKGVKATQAERRKLRLLKKSLRKQQSAL